MTTVVIEAPSAVATEQAPAVDTPKLTFNQRLTAWVKRHKVLAAMIFIAL